MATTAERVDIDLDHCLQVPATWGAYLRLLKAQGEKSNPRYTYVKGRLTIVSPGKSHDSLEERLGGLIEDLFFAFQMPYLKYGHMTLLKRVGSRAGKEGDKCYYLNNLSIIKSKRDLVMGIDPAPDLMVEVVFSHPEHDALKAYALFGVREVWVCKQSEVTFLVLGPDGQYASAATSACLPFLSSEELTPWAYRDDLPDDLTLRVLFRAWVVETLLPRVRGGNGGEP